MSASGGRKITSMLLYLLFSALPVVIIVVFYFQSIYRQMENELLTDDRRMVGRITENIDRGILSALDIMNRLYMDESLNEMIDRQYMSDNDFLTVYQDDLSTSMNMLVPINSPVRSCTIFTDNQTIFNTYLVQRLDMPVSGTGWYNPGLNYENPVFFHQYGEYNISEKKGVLLSFVRSMNMYRSHSRCKKLLKIDFVTDYFLPDMEMFGGSIYIVDSAGLIVASSGGAEMYGKPLPFDAESSEVYVTKAPINAINGWSVVGVSNVNSIRGRVMSQQIAAIIFLFIIAILMLFVIYKLVSDIFKGRLRETQIMLEKRQAQLGALQSQVNPHFFFNVLETVRMKLLLSGEREHSTILMRMAHLLRKLMLWKDDIVTIEEEISFISEFMSIQEYCYGERLSWSIEAEDISLSCTIPKMLLQTFAENACVHGIRGIGEKTEIRIFAGVKDGLLHCRVTDNGNGMSPETKERLNLLSSGDYNDESGIGFQNAVNRLKLYYGEAFSVNISSEEGAGTDVEITLPLQRNTG